MTKININDIMTLVNEEMDNNSNTSMQTLNSTPRKEEHDHEARMARSEVREMLINGMKLYKLIGPEDELPGWVSAYITLSSDYINSVTQYMIQDKVDDSE